MFLAFVLILLVAFSGYLVTYLFAEDETFLWRISAGNIVGSTIFGLFGFVIACFFGLSAATAGLTILLTLAPLSLLAKSDFRRRFQSDWEKAKGNLEGADFKKFLSLSYYVFFFVLFIFFFDRAMFQTSEGILTGGSQNLGDLPFHLGAIFSFTEGGNFPPQNPSFSGATFSYPFIADLLTAFLMKFGVSVENAMLLQNVSWAFSLLVILEKFTAKLTNNKLAGKIAPALLFFSGGIGLLWFYRDFAAQSKSLTDFLWHLPIDYTIRQATLRWGNSLNVLFITQRSILLGMPLTIVVLSRLWEIFEKVIDESANNKQTISNFQFPISVFFVGLLAGTLPLVHLHSLIVLFIVAAFLLVLKPENWREWIVFGVGVSLVAVPELVWSMVGSASRTSEFFGWHFGWDKPDDESFVEFWLKNTDIFVPLIVAGIGLLWWKSRRKIAAENQNESDGKKVISGARFSAIIFYLPFLFCFIIANVYRFAPWQWDNIKILIYWFVGSIPFVAYALAWAWSKNILLKIAAATCFLVLTSAGALDVWRIASKQINYNVFDADSIKIAEQIEQKTAPNAMFLNAPTYNSPVVLSGRRSLMRYTGHLSSHGIDFGQRLEDVERMYEGDATTAILMKKYGIEYVVISPEERKDLSPNEAYFSKFPVVAESGQYKIYKVN